MLKYTGQPMIDVGVAALTVWCRRPTPEALTHTDLEAAADYLQALYTTEGAMRTHALALFYFNAGYKQADKAFADRALRSWRAGAPRLAEPCAFCGRPAAYRANREYIPLLNGRDVFNFSPGGQAGFPVCGACSLAAQALPLGCLKSSGVLIAAHSEDPAVTQALAAAAQRRILAALTLDAAEVPAAPHPRTRLVELLVEWAAQAMRLTEPGGAVRRSRSLTGYLFTNYGSAPRVQVIRLAASTLDFLRLAAHHPDGSLSDAWARAIERGWAAPGKRKARRQAGPGTPAEPLSDRASAPNRLFEALLDLPTSAPVILRRDLIPTRHWGLVALFLRKGMGMDADHVALLKRLGERFAAYSQDRRAFFFEFLRTQEYALWRRAIIRAADDCARRRGELLISMDEFVEAFTAPDGEVNDWKLARDLVGLAMVDALRTADAPIELDEAVFSDDEPAGTADRSD